MATQRPSVKMITGDSRIGFGDIKANFPARVCFKLPTMADSRVVLDENGAESLLGKGDYLYKIAGSDLLQRAHSAFVSMDDIALILNSHEHIRGMYAAIS
jgi:S-DNA-T family DNA segregation ATPase FtsK/SpoIIIE